MAVAKEVPTDQQPNAAPHRVYEKPTLQRLGLLRLMTRYSIAGEDNQHGQHGDHGQHGQHGHSD